MFSINPFGECVLKNNGFIRFSTQSYSLNSPSYFFFYDYKIDFNNYLGEGIYGVLYGVVKRPNEEKSYTAAMSPYAYDYLYRVKDEEKQDTGYCVKLFKPMLMVLIQSISKSDPLFFLRMLSSLAEKSSEYNSNQLEKEEGMTNINFIETYSFYAQVKTRIIGKTLQYYIDNNYFQHPDRYALRKAFVHFVAKLIHSSLYFADLHTYNVMYDEINETMEIVDGYVVKRKSSVSILMKETDSGTLAEKIINALKAVAIKEITYTKELDTELLNNETKAFASEKPYQGDFFKQSNFKTINVVAPTSKPHSQ